ncbi:MAG TPA: WG repeat-containing protein [Bacteroidia bacterium]|nr:WG repeat-containing protein [Bacteroidia bacterium]
MRIFLTAAGLLFIFSSCQNDTGKLRAPARVKDKFGYIDELGNFVVRPKFDDAWSFIRGTAVVKDKNTFKLIGKNGKFISGATYDSVIPFSADCYIGMRDSLFGFFAHGTGKFIIEPQYKAVFKYTEDLCVVQIGKSLGIVNSKAKLVCPVELQDFRQLFGPCAIAVKYDTTDEVSMLMGILQGYGGKLGLINSRGYLIVEPAYDDMFDDAPAGFYYPFNKNPDAPPDTFRVGEEPLVPPGKYGIVDTTGKLIAKPMFEELPVYGEGLFRVRGGNKYGFIDTSGKMVIQPSYEFATAFGEGKAIASNNGVASIIDKKGNKIVADLGRGAGMYRFNNGLVRCRSEEGLYGYMDSTGRRIIPPQFTAADDFSNNRAIVSIGGKYGLIGRSGNFIIQPEYEFFYDLDDGYYQFKTAEGLAGVIDSTGKIILKAEYEEIFHLQKPFFTVEKNFLNGCYALNGKEIYPPVSRKLVYFFNGHSVVTNEDGKSGMIDTTGKLIVSTVYDSIGAFYKGYATVMKDGKSGMVDSTGKMICEIKYDELRPMINGYAVFRKGEKFGYVTAGNKEIIAAKFDDAAVLVDPDRKEFQ